MYHRQIHKCFFFQEDGQRRKRHLLLQISDTSKLHIRFSVCSNVLISIVIVLEVREVVILGGGTFLPNLKRGGGIMFFSRFSKACDISIKRADNGNR